MGKSEILTARVSDSLKARFVELAEKQKMKPGQLLALVVERVVGNNVVEEGDGPPVSSTTEKKDQRLYVKMNDQLKRELFAKARAQRMKTSPYVLGLIRSHLSKRPFFTEPEMDALSRATNELTAIGRNINQIAKALNTSLDNRDQVKAGELKRMYDKVVDVRDEVRALVSANLKAWGVENGEEVF